MLKKNFSALLIAVSVILLHCAAYCASWEAVAGLVYNNDDLVSAAKQADSAHWSYNKAWTAYYPQVSLSGSYSETTQSGTDETTKAYSTGFNVKQTLFSGFQNYNALRSANASYQQAVASYNKTLSDVYFNVRSAFIGLYIAQANIDLSGQILSRLSANARMIKLMYDSGREDRGNLMATQASQKNGEFGVSSAKRELELARLKLSQLISAEISTTDGVMNLTFEAAPDFKMLAENCPAYLIAKYQLELAEIDDQNTLGEFLPTAQVSWGNQSSGTEWPTSSNSQGWNLNLSYSLFPGGANIADKFINDLNQEKARRDFESSKKTVLLSIEDSYRSLRDAVESLEVSRVLMDADSERAKIADAKYQNGLMTFDEWNRIISDYINAQRSFLQARSTALQASAAWKNSYGGYEK